MTTTIRLRGPADIITVLPYHLGYRPADSLVLVLLDGARIGMVARIDLPPPSVDPMEVADELLPFVMRERPDRAVIVGFETWPGHSEAVSVALRDGLVEVGIDTVERLLVRDGRWWGLDCDGGCCPPDGELLPSDDRVPAVSDYVALGRFPAASRRHLAERLAYTRDPVQDARCAALIPELGASRRSARARHRRRRRVLEAWGRILRPGPADGLGGLSGAGGISGVGEPGPSEEDWAWAVVGLRDITVRDLVIAWLCPGTLGLEVFPVALRRVAEAHLPPRGRLPPGLARLTALPDLDLGSGPDDIDRNDIEPDNIEPGNIAPAEPAEPAEPVEPVEPVGPVGPVGPVEPREGRTPALDSETLVERLAMLCRRSPPELSPGPLTIIGHVTWWLGDGALARTAVERALEVDPDYRLALLLSRMVDVAIRPPRSA